MNRPKANAVLVDALGSSLRYGGSALNQVPDLVKRIIREEAWREFVTQRGELVRHDRFVDFVTTPPLKGLGATMNLLKRICADDPEALDLIDQAMQQEHGGDRRSGGFKRDNVTLETPRRQAGNSKDYALRKLRKDAPELHAEVLARRLSPHAAMVKAGFRPKTFTVRRDPESAARTLRKHMSPDDLRTLARLLLEEEDA